MLVRGRTGYSVTGRALSENFDQLRPQFEQIAASLTFTVPALTAEAPTAPVGAP